MPATKKASTKKPSEIARAKGPATYDRLKKKQARTRDIDIYLDDELAEKVQELRKQVEKDELFLARVRGNKGEAPEREAELERRREQLRDYESELAEETITMKFQALGRKRYEALLEEHPPTDEQVEEAKKEEQNKPDFNVDTFPVALVATSCIEPGDLDVDSYWDAEKKQTRYPRAEEIFETWNADELGYLYMAALEVNTRRRVVDQGKG